jgi:hypothetical protein
VFIVEILWDDAAYNSASWSAGDLRRDFGLASLSTVGWLVEEKPDCFILASERNIQESSFRHIVAIPKSCVKHIRKIRGARK